jgi:hypothetical protein
VDPLITFPNPQRAARDILRAHVPSLAEGVTSAQISTKDLPGADEARTLPYVRVVSDGRFRDSRLNGRATIRVVVWHEDAGLAEDLAALCEAVLLSRTSADMRGASSISGPLTTGDPDNGLPMSYFTVTARLTPRQLP